MGWLSFLFGTKSSPRGNLTALDRERIQERWRWIEDQKIIGKPNSLKLAVLEADKLVDEVLKILFSEESTMAERMKLSKEKFYSREIYNDLWYAHKVRNVIAHEVSYDLPSFEAKNVLDKYNAALRELGAL